MVVPNLAYMDEIPMDKGHTLDQLTGRFQTVQDGAPELLKNAKDQYARLGIVDPKDRQVVIIADPKSRSLAVLDFAGAPYQNFEGWSKWSSRTASQADKAHDIEGGHGNGGKAFMVRGSTTESYMESCYHGRWTKMGFNNAEPERRYLPGYHMFAGKKVRNLTESDPATRLRTSLEALGLKPTDLPTLALAAFEKRKAFTIVVVGGVLDWDNKRPAKVLSLIEEIPQSLQNHAQAALTLETSTVWMMIGDRVVNDAPLTPAYPAPMADFEDLAPIPVPPILTDPETGEDVATGTGDATTKLLLLRTSKEQLRISDRRKALNAIRVRNDRNVVANWSVADLVPVASSAYIYGELRVPDLKGHHLAGAERQILADTPLTRALKAWVSEQVTDLARRIQQSMGKNEAKAEREQASTTLGRMRDLMLKFLRPENSGPGADESGPTGNNGKGNGGKPAGNGDSGRRGQVVHGIDLEPGREKITVALGTTVPLRIRAYEISPDGEKLSVSGVQYEALADMPIAELVEGNQLRAKKPGKTAFAVMCKPAEIISSVITLEVVECSGASITEPPRILKQGEREQLEVYFHTDSGIRSDLIVEASVDETSMGRVNRHAQFTAGRIPGTATVRVRFGGDPLQTTVAEVSISDEVVEPEDASGGSGGIPRILLCGTPYPGMEDYPPEQRTHEGGEGVATIIDYEPQWENKVIWINHRSKESLKFRSSRGGSSGMASVVTKTYQQQFLASKCFEILKRLWVRQEMKDGAMTYTDVLNLMASSETACADFLDDAYNLVESMVNGHREGAEDDGE